MDNVDPSRLAFLKSFELPGSIQSIEKIDVGRIHETYLGRWSGGESFIHQRINPHVFPDLGALEENYTAVFQHLERCGYPIRLIPHREGGCFLRHKGEVWRTLTFLENAESYDVCPSSIHAEAAGRTLSRFHGLLSSLPPAEYPLLLPGFQSTEKRRAEFESSFASAQEERLEEVSEFQDELRSLFYSVRPFFEAELPRSLIHYDPKFNNFLFRKSDLSDCTLIDLDLVSGGSRLIDYGDFIRSIALEGSEDQRGGGEVSINRDRITRGRAGFISALDCPLSEAERKNLPLAPPCIALNLAYRYFTDYLQGDRYFKVRFRDDNLQRGRRQLGLASQLLNFTPENDID